MSIYRELDEIADAVAVGLLANGLTAGERVALYLQNVPQFVIGLVGACSPPTSGSDHRMGAGTGQKRPEMRPTGDHGPTDR